MANGKHVDVWNNNCMSDGTENYRRNSLTVPRLPTTYIDRHLHLVFIICLVSYCTGRREPIVGGTQVFDDEINKYLKDRLFTGVVQIYSFDRSKYESGKSWSFIHWETALNSIHL